MRNVRGHAVWLALGLASTALSGCLETTFAVSAAKQVAGGESPKPQGVYKVGEPYQINGTWYYPAEDYRYNETGIASFYGGETSGTNFHGRLTANGEVYDMNALTAAHQTLPLPSLVRVTNLENGRSVVLRVNDRGPFARGRILDVSRRSAQLLGFEGKGTAMVRVQVLADESRQLKMAMLQGTTPPATEVVAAAPRGAIQSDTLPPPPGARSAGRVASAALPPPSETLAQTQNGTSQQQRNGRTRTTTQPLAKPAAPVVAAPGHTPSAAATPLPVTSGPTGAAPPASSIVVTREVAALPVPEQAKARATVQQQQVRPANMFVQAGAFSNYDNAYRLSSRLSRYGKTQITPVSVNGQELFRVRIGPVATVQEADNILEWVTEVAPQARIVVAD